MVPSSAANALPTLPAIIMAVTTGDNSLANAKANTPPTDLVNPNLANSRTNCHIGVECQTPRKIIAQDLCPNHPIWRLENLSRKCIPNQDDFCTKFGEPGKS
jgi:hypothetical protein